jgi:methionyl-tRNA synthetase
MIALCAPRARPPRGQPSPSGSDGGRGDLYLARYEGWYSVRDEAFYDETSWSKGRGDKLSPQGTPVEWTVEETWFFRLSKYRDFLLELNETPDSSSPKSAATRC